MALVYFCICVCLCVKEVCFESCERGFVGVCQFVDVVEKYETCVHHRITKRGNRENRK